MRELSLFSGAGGGLLGTKLLGFRSVGYVERDPFCQAVLEARIRDGLLDPAPIFGDIRAFLRDGWAERYRGLVDVVTAGFPCQPFSVAGRRLGADDARNLWPETAECLRRVRPRFALLENVPGLTAAQRITLLVLEAVRQVGLFDYLLPQSVGGRIHRRIVQAVGPSYFARVLGDLAEIGFDAEWCVLGANDAGAPHRRKRLWILAHLPDTEREFVSLEPWRLGREGPEGMESGRQGATLARRDGCEESLADSRRR